MDFDRAVIAALFAEEHVRLRGLLVRRGVPAPAAGDAVQDTFLRLLRAPLHEIRDLRAYLRRVAESVAVDTARRRRGRSPPATNACRTPHPPPRRR